MAAMSGSFLALVVFFVLATTTAGSEATCWSKKHLTSSGQLKAKKHHIKECKDSAGQPYIMSCESDIIPPHCRPNAASKQAQRKQCLRDRSNSTLQQPGMFDLTPVNPCTPFAYIKNMKTGGSTLRTILLAHARERSLQSEVHLRIQEWAVKPLVGRDNDLQSRDRFLWITSMRTPADRVHSHYWQCRMFPTKGLCAKANNITSFIADSVHGHLQRQFLSFTNEDTGEEAINQLDLVLLTERFSESLILLHLKLGLSITSMMYMSSKVRPHKSWNLSPAQEALLVAATAEEQQWYEYAVARFNRTVASIEETSGGRFSAAVAKLVQLNAEFSKACGHLSLHGDEQVLKDAKALAKADACKKQFCESNAVCRSGTFDEKLYKPIHCNSNSC